tara:strand:- start:9165 stop:9758 length:594 start_codon:yes stop_codon:yes gene_type:complete
MTVQTFDNYSLIENVLTDAQINTLIEWWDNKEYLLDADGNPEVRDRNYWELGLDLKQKIESNIRQTEIIALPLSTFSWLNTTFNNIFTAVHGSSLTIEGPTYFNKYTTGSFHSLHNDIKTDEYPNRKYVCSIQLSDASDYTGGDLQICKYINDLISTAEYQTPTRVKASAIIYDNRAVHNVTEITSGTRYSINECAG